jgi:hypothetical protein
MASRSAATAGRTPAVEPSRSTSRDVANEVESVAAFMVNAGLFPAAARRAE